MNLRLRHETLGGHTHVDIFLADSPKTTGAKCGSLCFRKEEFPLFAQIVANGTAGADCMVDIYEKSEEPPHLSR